jgi:nicotinate-nucleotide adenylyltransferase
VSGRPRVGVLGGSFDPPHIGHLAVASEACAALSLDHVLFVIAAAPPHKGAASRTAPATRLELTRLAAAGDPRFSASDIEMDRGLVFTTDTLRALLAEDPARDLVFILGSDSLLQIGTWHEPEELFRLSEVAVAPRPGDRPEAVAAAAARWGGSRATILEMPLFGVSSSEIRTRVAAGRPIRYLVPAPVEARIRELGLYR